MHEFSIAQGLIEAATAEARRVGATRVTRLKCRIGSLRQVDDTLLQEAFAIVCQGTLCDSALLMIEKTSMRAMCPKCQSPFDIHGWEWCCPTCGTLGQQGTGGDELDLLSLDAEIPDGGTGS